MDIIFGMDNVQYDVSSVLDGVCDVNTASIKSPLASNLYILCAPKDPFYVVTAEQITQICQDIKKYYDYIIIDTGAGINSHVFDIVAQSNLILVVTTPDPICIRDARMMSDAFYTRGNQRQRLIINKVTKDAMGASLIRDLDEIIDTIGVQLIGVVPEDYQLVSSTGKGQPIPSGSPSLNALEAIARRIQGEDIPLTIK
jgi:septum site-determining protein MinD